MQLDANTVLLTILTVAGVVNKILDRAAKKVAAHKVEEVKTALQVSTEENKNQVAEVRNALEVSTTKADKKLGLLQETADDTHLLVNSKMTLQLTLSAISARALAKLTKKPELIKKAVEAERALAHHLKNQAKVDQAIEARKSKK